MKRLIAVVLSILTCASFTLLLPEATQAAAAVNNGDFANGLSGWSSYGAVSARTDGGASVAQVIGYAGVNQVVAVQPQTDYVMTVRLRLSAAGQEARCALQVPETDVTSWVFVKATSYQVISVQLRSGTAGKLNLICYVPQRSGTALD